MTISRVHEFVGANIKGTPAMPGWKVRADLRVLRARADLMVLQEFRWPAYWEALDRALVRDRWGSAPPRRVAEGRPVWAAQANAWLRSEWAFVRTVDHLLHEGRAGISESRWLRSTLVADRDHRDLLRVWAGTTHFVVGGDRAGDGPIRRRMLAHDMERLDHHLTIVSSSGWPVIFQLDANIARNSAAYDDFRKMLRKHDATIYGAHGIEYLFTLPGERCRVPVSASWTVPTSRLHTDHEARGITFRLVT